jgi:hypothetical protein
MTMRGHARVSVGALIIVLALAGAGPAAAVQCCRLQKESFESYPIYPHVGENCNVYNLAQSFTVTESYTLCRADVVLGPGGGPVTLYVQNGPLPGATVYTQGSIVVTGGEGWYRFDVDDFDLVVGQTYYLRVTGEILWRRTGENIDYYPGGQAYLNGSPGPNDFFFRTFTWMECPDDECATPMDAFATYPLSPRVGYNTYFVEVSQSFVPEENYTLCAVCAVLDGVDASSATLYLQSMPDAGPGIIYTWTSRSGIGAEGWYCFDIPDYDVLAGETYYIRIESPEHGVEWMSYQDTSGGDPYPRGGAYHEGSLIDDTSPGHTDFWFVCFCYGWAAIDDLKEFQSSWGTIKALYR